MVVLAVLYASVSCKHVRPKPPVTQDFEPPIPDPISYVAGDITFKIADLERKINKSLGVVLVPEETFEGKKGEAWHLRVERTGPVKINYANRQVSFSAPLQVWYTNPIGLSKKRKSRRLCSLSVNFVSPLSIASNWRLSTRSRFENYQWIQQPTVRLLGVKIGVTKLAESMLNKRKADIEAAIDNAVHSELRLDRHISKIWRDMQKPLRIAKKPEEIWIVPKPFSIAAAPVFGDSKRITVPLQIAFRVDTKVGAMPVVTELERLPRLLRRAKMPEASRLAVRAFIPYEDANRILAKALDNQNLKLPGGKVKIKRATIYGGGRSLIVKTEVAGSVNGTLYFHGQPSYDTLNNTLQVKYLDFDVDTKERLFATADWLLHDHLRDTLQSVMVVPLRHEISELPKKIETAFAQGEAGRKTSLDINAFRLVPQRVVVRPDGVQLLIKVESKIAVKVRKL
ncbi:hypothetical protein GCM10028825_11630 [Spirosoma agri]